MAKFGSSYEPDDKKPAYDLRQIYAEKLLGDTLQKIKLAREERKFSVWFNLIRIDLIADVNQKFSKVQREEINKVVNEVIDFIDANPYAYLGKDTNPITVEQMLQKIFKLELLIKEYMEDKKIYGGSDEDIGL